MPPGFFYFQGCILKDCGFLSITKKAILKDYFRKQFSYYPPSPAFKSGVYFFLDAGTVSIQAKKEE
jgi:hypothetical protein